MAGIKSINEPRAPLNADLQQPKILTSAIADPPKPTMTDYTPEEIVAMCLMEKRLFVATRNGVYELNDGIFKRMKFEIVEEPNES